MCSLQEGRLQFNFAESCLAEKFDTWSFYREQFQNTCGGAKAVDIVCLSDNQCWLIEVKDYRQFKRTKPQELGLEVAIKVRDTLACLVAAQLNANDASEKNFAKKALRSKVIKVVLHLEQPEKHSRLFPHAIDPAAVKQSLKRHLGAIDPHPRVVNRKTLSSFMEWSVIG